jgi:hypothetical protein
MNTIKQMINKIILFVWKFKMVVSYHIKDKNGMMRTLTLGDCMYGSIMLWFLFAMPLIMITNLVLLFDSDPSKATFFESIFRLDTFLFWSSPWILLIWPLTLLKLILVMKKGIQEFWVDTLQSINDKSDDT